MIKNFVRVFVLVAFFVTAIQGSAFARQTFTLVNHSERTVTGFYCAVVGEGWSPNIIGAGGFPNGGVTTVWMDNDARYWNFKAELSDGSSWEWGNIDVVETGTIEIQSNGSLLHYAR